MTGRSANVEMCRAATRTRQPHDGDDDNQCVACKSVILNGVARYQLNAVNGEGSAAFGWTLCVSCGLDVRRFVGEPDAVATMLPPV